MVRKQLPAPMMRSGTFPAVGKMQVRPAETFIYYAFPETRWRPTRISNALGRMIERFGGGPSGQRSPGAKLLRPSQREGRKPLPRQGAKDRCTTWSMSGLSKKARAGPGMSADGGGLSLGIERAERAANLAGERDASTADENIISVRAIRCCSVVAKTICGSCLLWQWIVIVHLRLFWPDGHAEWPLRLAPVPSPCAKAKTARNCFLAVVAAICIV